MGYHRSDVYCYSVPALIALLGFLIGLILIDGQIFELDDEKKCHDSDLSVLCIMNNFGAQEASERESRNIVCE